MILATLTALCLLAPAQGDLHWPLVPGPQFVFNGIDAGGTANNSKLIILVGSTSRKDSKVHPIMLPAGTDQWKTLQLAFTYTTDGTLAKFGGISLVAKRGRLSYLKQGKAFDIAPLSVGDLNDVQILKHNDSIIAYVNGTKALPTIRPTESLFPVHVGLDTWTGPIIAACSYLRELSIDELYANERAVQSISKALFGDTLKVKVEGELTASTPIPELERIRPYRSALLAEEYKVVRIVSGRMSALKSGQKIRIFRYGIRAGEKTDVKNAKIGDHAEMVIQAYDSDPKFGREFQVDGLDPDLTILQFVDVTPVK